MLYEWYLYRNTRMNTEHARDQNVSDLPPTPPFSFQVAPWQSSTIIFQLERIFED